MRVHELAKELGVTSKELLETLEQMGVSGKSASSSVPEDIVPRLRASGGGNSLERRLGPWRMFSDIDSRVGEFQEGYAAFGAFQRLAAENNHAL